MIVPTCGHAEGVGDFGFQVEVADVAVGVAIPADHVGRHVAGAPGIALIEIRRARLAGVAEFVGFHRRRLVTRKRGHVEIRVRLLVITGIEGGRIGGVHHAVACDIAGIHPHHVVTNAEQRAPRAVPAMLPLDERSEALARAVIDVDEVVRPHHRLRAGDRRPPIIERHTMELVADAENVCRRQRNFRLY